MLTYLPIGCAFRNAVRLGYQPDTCFSHHPDRGTVRRRGRSGKEGI